MTPIALALNLLLGVLLMAALGLGLRLDRRLRALRESQAGFIKAVAELDQAAARTHVGLQQWRDATDEARELLHDRIEKAKLQAERLDSLLDRAARAPAPAPRPAEPPPAGPQQTPGERLAERLRAERMAARPREAVAEAEARAEAVAETVLNLTARDALRSREADPLRLRPREPARARAAIDDDLFDLGPLDRAPSRRERAFMGRH